MKKYLILVLVFWILAIFQESFLVYFEILGARLNLILITVFLLNFVEPKKKNFGIFAGLFGGVVLDLSSTFPIGTFFLTLVVLSFLIKKMGVLFQKSNIIAAFLIFLFSFFFYKFAAPSFGTLVNFFFQNDFNFASSLSLETFLLEFLYNFLLVALLFVFLKKYGFLSEK